MKQEVSQLSQFGASAVPTAKLKPMRDTWRDSLQPTNLRHIASDEEPPLERTHLQRACLQPLYFYQHVFPLTLFRKGSCLQCNCSLISGNQSERPHLITILSSLSIIWGKDQSLTYSLKHGLSFSGGGGFLHQ